MCKHTVLLIGLIGLMAGCTGAVVSPYVTDNAAWTPVERMFNGVAMMQVPPGCFMMGSESGSEDERPVHEVCFERAFWIDKTEVSQAQFAAFGGEMLIFSQFQGSTRPVENLSWFEARDFCARRDARLPSEAEWEYAARGPDSLTFPWGETVIVSRAAFQRTERSGTAIVGLYPAGASWVGALDMSGNVWEWTNSRLVAYPFSASDGREIAPDAAAALGIRMVLRGSAWDTMSDYTLRLTSRNSADPGERLNSWGVRCARDDAP